MAVSIFLFANLTIVVGCCLGWAWGAAGMAAALRARDRTFLAQQLQRTQSDVAGATNPEVEYQRIIFEGRFLDVKSTAIFGIFLCTGAYFAAVMQVKMPKLKIAAIFFCIVLDVLCSYGPLFPFGQYTLATIFLIPIGCSVAISLACSFLIFPRTLNYGWQMQLVKAMRLGRSILGVHRDALARVASPSETDTPSQVEAKTEPKLRTMHAGFVGLAQALGGQTGFLELEISYGRLSAKDLAAIFLSVRQAGVKLLGLNAFLHLFEGSDLVDENVQSTAKETEERHRRGAKAQAPIQLHETHQLLRYRKLARTAERENHVELKTLLAILEEAARPPLEAADKSLDTMATWFEESCNRKRSYRHDEWVRKLKESADSLETSLKVFVEQERFQLIRPYMHLFKKRGTIDSDTIDQYIPAENRAAFRKGARPLYTTFVFAANLCIFAEGLIQLNREVHKLASKRPKNRLWFPSGLRKLGNVLVSKAVNTGGAFHFSDGHAPEADPASLSTDSSSLATSTSDTVADSEDHQEKSKDEAAGHDESPSMTPKKEKEAKSNSRSKKKAAKYAKDADALAPTSFIHHIGRALASACDFIGSPTGLYALKFSIVSFALWIPAVLPSTAEFVYMNRGLWALIMAQTGLAVLGGEFVFSLISRVLGTGFGIVLGMLFWYISTGRGNGNPYGLAATCAVGFIPIMFIRLFAPPAFLFFGIMFGVTTVLVTGYSWIDSHLFVLANSGIGYDVAWRRGLLVLIGVAAAFIVTIFPRPASTRAMIRETFARNTAEIARLYSTVIQAWIVIREEEGEGAGSLKGHQQSDDKATTAQLQTGFRNRFVASQGTLAYLDQQIKMASLDFPIRGRWPRERYEELLVVQARLLESLSQLSSSLAGLDEDWRSKTLQLTAILDPGIISEVSMTLALLGQALMTGIALPHAFQNLLETTLHYNSVARAVEYSIERQQRPAPGETSGGEGQEQGRAEEESVNELDLSLATLRDPQFMRHAAALMALIQFVRQIDRFKAVVGDLVGEIALPGFDRLKDTYDDRLGRAFPNYQ